MKKMYESPVAEKIEFHYADQVVASGKVEYPGECDYISGGVPNPGTGEDSGLVPPPLTNNSSDPTCW